MFWEVVNLISFILVLPAAIITLRDFGPYRRKAAGKSRTAINSSFTLASRVGVVCAMIASTFGLAIISLSSLTNFVTLNHDKILNTISNPLFVFPACIAGLMLFRLRGRYPAIYGTLEIWVAITAIIVSIKSPTGDILPKLVAIAGGVYILVRGLDNIEKGIPESFKTGWNKIFPKQKR